MLEFPPSRGPQAPAYARAVAESGSRAMHCPPREACALLRGHDRHATQGGRRADRGAHRDAPQYGRFAMPYVAVDGIRLWYEETGAGEALVQIHGGGLGHANFALATPRLARSFRVIDYDQRGYGQSDCPHHPYD